jgi:hypothetical protein
MSGWDRSCRTSGLAPLALGDIKTANQAGRFRVADPELAVTLAAGALLAWANYSMTSPAATTPSQRPDGRRPATCLRPARQTGT